MAGRRVDRLGMARGGTVTPAIIRRAEMRAALQHLAWNADVRQGGGRSSHPRGRRADFFGMQQGFAASATCRADHQSEVHSQTLPIMS